jgi:hypothetical protein
LLFLLSGFLDDAHCAVGSLGPSTALKLRLLAVHCSSSGSSARSTAAVGTELAVDVGAVCVGEVLRVYLALRLLLNVIASHLHLVFLDAVLLIPELLSLGHLPGGFHPLLLADSELLLLIHVLLLLLLLLQLSVLTLILLVVLLLIIIISAFVVV